MATSALSHTLPSNGTEETDPAAESIGRASGQRSVENLVKGRAEGTLRVNARSTVTEEGQ